MENKLHSLHIQSIPFFGIFFLSQHNIIYNDSRICFLSTFSRVHIRTEDTKGYVILLYLGFFNIFIVEE